ncbi:MAG TPA: hypothetical protein PLF11_00010 [Bacillota bacterium]|nr:hypothetical protein [Bacillota bacterium]
MRAAYREELTQRFGLSEQQLNQASLFLLRAPYSSDVVFGRLLYYLNAGKNFPAALKLAETEVWYLAAFNRLPPVSLIQLTKPRSLRRLRHYWAWYNRLWRCVKKGVGYAWQRVRAAGALHHH